MGVHPVTCWRAHVQGFALAVLQRFRSRALRSAHKVPKQASPVWYEAVTGARCDPAGWHHAELVAQQYVEFLEQPDVHEDWCECVLAMVAGDLVCLCQRALAASRPEFSACFVDDANEVALGDRLVQLKRGLDQRPLDWGRLQAMYKRLIDTGDPWSAAGLATQVSGGFWTQDRLFRHGAAQHPNCLYCGELGTMAHRVFHFCRWHPQRARMFLQFMDTQTRKLRGFRCGSAIYSNKVSYRVAEGLARAFADAPSRLEF
eukprot:1594733-Amphidinium_carterae.2